MGRKLRCRGYGKPNTSGYVGVYYMKKIDRYIASIWADGVMHYVGSYPTALDAHTAREARILSDPDKYRRAPKRVMELNEYREEVDRHRAEVDRESTEKVNAVRASIAAGTYWIENPVEHLADRILRAIDKG